MFLRDKQYKPVGCIAINVDRKNRQLNYHYSVLNPMDSFDRKEARVLALGRMMDAPVFIPLPRGKELTMHSISHAVMSHLAKSNAPSRAVKAAKMWLSRSEMFADML
jgi:hypothetical protein